MRRFIKSAVVVESSQAELQLAFLVDFTIGPATITKKTKTVFYNNGISVHKLMCSRCCQWIDQSAAGVTKGSDGNMTWVQRRKPQAYESIQNIWADFLRMCSALHIIRHYILVTQQQLVSIYFSNVNSKCNDTRAQPRIKSIYATWRTVELRVNHKYLLLANNTSHQCYSVINLQVNARCIVCRSSSWFSVEFRFMAVRVEPITRRALWQAGTTSSTHQLP